MIIACEGEPATSMERLLGGELDLAKVEDKIVENFAEVFGMRSEKLRNET